MSKLPIIYRDAANCSADGSLQLSNSLAADGSFQLTRKCKFPAPCGYQERHIASGRFPPRGQLTFATFCASPQVDGIVKTQKSEARAQSGAALSQSGELI